MRPTTRPGVIIKNDFSIDHLLIHEAHIARYSSKRIPGGAYVKEWNLVKEEPVSCRFTVYTPRDTQQVNERRETFNTSYMVFTKGTEDVKKGDVFIFKGVLYEVKDNPLNPSFLDHHLEIQAEILPTEEVLNEWPPSLQKILR